VIDPKMGLVADGFAHPEGRRWLVALCVIVIFATFYAFFVPLVYGTPMSASAFQARMWFKAWE
jgi:dolichyl-phosphate-mannose--protein O-mannosyl transferase